MIAVYVTYDTSIHKWVIYHGWAHELEDTAEEVDKWLAENKLEYIEVKR